MESPRQEVGQEPPAPEPLEAQSTRPQLRVVDSDGRVAITASVSEGVAKSRDYVERPGTGQEFNELVRGV